jgi:hypothetical protein
MFVGVRRIVKPTTIFTVSGGITIEILESSMQRIFEGISVPGLNILKNSQMLHTGDKRNACTNKEHFQSTITWLSFTSDLLDYGHFESSCSLHVSAGLKEWLRSQIITLHIIFVHIYCHVYE